MNVFAKPSAIQRIGVFYDGGFLHHVSDFYLTRHARRKRLNLAGFHEFIRKACSDLQGVPVAKCRIVEAHYFRGRFAARDAIARDVLTADRYWDDVLMHHGVTPHYLPLTGGNGERISEKGIDVLFAVETLDRSIRGLYDVVVLVACDGDYAPLAKRLGLHGLPVLLLGWDLGDGGESRTGSGTRTSHKLMAESTHAILMNELIDHPDHAETALIEGLFLRRRDGGSQTADTPVSSPAVASPTPDDTPIHHATTEHVEHPQVDSGPSEALSGSIFRLKDGYGFIESRGLAQHVFFHRSVLRDTDFATLQLDEPVEFAYSTTERGLVADYVQSASTRSAYRRDEPRRAPELTPVTPAARWRADAYGGGYPL